MGAKAFDASRLASDFGYVFDHATPSARSSRPRPPTTAWRRSSTGVAAHAGIRPEQGRSAIVAAARAIAAMPTGRIDEQSTVNVGSIEGGSASTNVVPARCRVEAEARSLDEDTVDAIVAEMVDHLHDGANAAECDVDVTVERLFRGYRTRPSAPAIAVARRRSRPAATSRG